MTNLEDNFESKYSRFEKLNLQKNSGSYFTGLSEIINSGLVAASACLYLGRDNSGNNGGDTSGRTGDIVILGRDATLKFLRRLIDEKEAIGLLGAQASLAGAGSIPSTA